MFKIIIISLLFSVIVSAQELLNLYRPVLHSKNIDSEAKRKEVSNTFSRLANYNPELIYYYYVFLKLQSEGLFGVKDAEGYLEYIENEFYKKLKGWIDNEINILDHNDLKPAHKLNLRTYYYLLSKKASETVPIKTEPYNINNNYKNYLVYLYYKNEYEAYQESSDYALLTNEILKPVIAEITYSYYNTREYSDNELEGFYDFSRENPFLFKGSLLECIDNPVPVYQSEYLIKITSNKFMPPNGILAGIGINLTKINIDDILEYTDESNLDLKLIFRNMRRAVPAVSVGISIALGETKRIFSALNINLSAGFQEWSSPVEAGLPNNWNYFILRHNNFGYRINPNYKIASENSGITYLLKMTTPVLYLSSSTSLEAGIYFRYSSIDYNISISRNDEYSITNTSYPQELLVKYKDRKISFSDKTSKMLPLFSINSVLADYLILRLSGTSEYFPQVDIFYRFGL
jgi:hypothetical protein